MKPEISPKVEFELIEVENNKLFVDRAQLPLTKLDFIRLYTPLHEN